MCAEQNSTISETGLVKPLPAWQRRSLSAKQRNFAHFSLGESGERQAMVFVKKLGWYIQSTNIKYSYYEADIIAIDPENNDLVFIEVKTRSTPLYGDPSLAVSRKKIAGLQRLASKYLEAANWKGTYRFDTISVLPGTIHHYRNITWYMKR